MVVIWKRMIHFENSLSNLKYFEWYYYFIWNGVTLKHECVVKSYKTVETIQDDNISNVKNLKAFKNL